MTRNKDKSKDERTVTTEDIVSGLYVELLASDINRVKLNRIYRENEEQAYLKMKTSKLNEYKFIKQATIRKTVEFKKAIGLVERLEGIIDELESTSQVQDRVQVEVRDRCEIDKEIKDTMNKNEVAQLGLSPLQSTVKSNCEVDCEVDYEAEIYVIGGYDRLINKLRAKFVNMVSDEKGYKGFVGKERVFILSRYVSHADIYKIESLGYMVSL